ncbi:MAG: radical SAM protein, partial [Clostridia bacterium]|nr:radical SAM protein [Clostridia bacterium]
LVLAKKRDGFLYNGAEVCEDFGNDNFYYTASIMNCAYNCEYCYLQGMYPSGYIVVFVNIEDTFFELKKMLSIKKNIYLCISYDTDLLAVEGITGFVSKWMAFAQQNDNLKIELRTKCSNYKVFESQQPLENFILSWTLSPKEIIHQFEKNTSSLQNRLSAIKATMRMGWIVRLCFDPIIQVDGWQNMYEKMVKQVFDEVDGTDIEDISIGVFRISKDYMKNILNKRPNSSIINFPFTCIDGVMTYSDELRQEMIQLVYKEVGQHVSRDKIYY